MGKSVSRRLTEIYLALDSRRADPEAILKEWESLRDQAMSARGARRLEDLWDYHHFGAKVLGAVGSHDRAIAELEQAADVAAKGRPRNLDYVFGYCLHEANSLPDASRILQKLNAEGRLDSITRYTVAGVFVEFAEKNPELAATEELTTQLLRAVRFPGAANLAQRPTTVGELAEIIKQMAWGGKRL